MKNSFLQSKVCDFPAPTKVFIEITSVCNLNCSHCFQNGTDNARMLRWQDMSSLAKILSKAGVFEITLTGGEPFLNTDIEKILRVIPRYPLMRFSIASNGILLTKKLSDLIAQCKIERVCISIDGPEEVHNSIRGPGTFQKACKGIQKLVRKKVSTYLSFTQMNSNKNVIEQVIQLAKDLGCQGVLSQGVLPAGNAVKNHEPLAFIQDNIGHSYIFDEGRKVKVTERPRGGCAMGKEVATITANKELYMCKFIGKETLIGTIGNDDNFLTLWRSEKAREVKKVIGEYPLCKECKSMRACPSSFLIVSN